jgi:N-acetylneuraminic acid mutarotase
MPILRRLPYLAAVTLLALAACTPQPQQDQGAAQVVASAQQALSASDVTRVRVTVSAADMTPRVVELAKSSGLWGGLIGNLPAGSNRTFLAEAFDSSGTLRFQGQATGVTITANQTVAVAITLQEVPPPPPYGNEAPVIDSLVSSATSVTAGGTLSLTAAVHDPNAGDTLTFAWSATGGTFSAPAAASTSWTAPTSVGVQLLTFTVTDSQGAAVAISVAVNVISGVSTGDAAVNISFNLWPVVSKVSATLNRLGAGQSTTLSANASDADGDALSYQWTATCPATWTNATSSTASFVPSSVPASACNNCQLTVTVRDGRGGQTTGSLSLCVTGSSTDRFPPHFTNYYQSATTSAPGQTVNFDVTALDPQASSLTFSWSANVGSLATAQNTASTSHVVWTAPACAPAGLTPSVTATVTNGYGLSASKPFSLSALPTCDAEWTTAAPLLRTRDHHAAVLLQSGKVLVTGGGFIVGSGSSISITYLASSELYDPVTNSWSSAGTLALARYDPSAVLLQSGKVLVVGGTGPTGTSNTAELYDPATNSWSSAGTLAGVYTQNTATLLTSGKVLVTGGLGTAELYDPATNSWSSASPMSVGRLRPAATLLSSGKVLVAGGYTSGPVYLNSVEVYDPTTNSWATVRPMGTVRYNHTATLLSSGKVLVVGGYNPTSFHLASAELYDPATNSWSSAGAMSGGRSDHPATLLSSGKVLIAGGVANPGLSDLYDPSTNSWSSTAPMASSRYNHSVTPLPSGKVLVAGGVSAGATIRTAELYSP